MVNIILGLLGSLGVALLVILGLRNKNKALNLINDNAKVIEEVKDLANKVTANEGDIKVEEQVRTDLQKNIDEINAQKASQEQILSFFNQGPKK
jgi:hypothetical protein